MTADRPLHEDPARDHASEGMATVSETARPVALGDASAPVNDAAYLAGALYDLNMAMFTNCEELRNVCDDGLLERLLDDLSFMHTRQAGDVLAAIRPMGLSLRRHSGGGSSENLATRPIGLPSRLRGRTAETYDALLMAEQKVRALVDRAIGSMQDYPAFASVMQRHLVMIDTALSRLSVLEAQ